MSELADAGCGPKLGRNRIAKTDENKNSVDKIMWAPDGKYIFGVGKDFLSVYNMDRNELLGHNQFNIKNIITKLSKRSLILYMSLMKNSCLNISSNIFIDFRPKYESQVIFILVDRF